MFQLNSIKLISKYFHTLLACNGLSINSSTHGKNKKLQKLKEIKLNFYLTTSLSVKLRLIFIREESSQ